jgi:hypothetical protein
MLEDRPWKNLFIRDKVMKSSLFYNCEISPNTMKLDPIQNMPKTMRFLLPSIMVILPMTGDPKITATE